MQTYTGNYKTSRIYEKYISTWKHNLYSWIRSTNCSDDNTPCIRLQVQNSTLWNIRLGEAHPDILRALQGTQHRQKQSSQLIHISFERLFLLDCSTTFELIALTPGSALLQDYTGKDIFQILLMLMRKCFQFLMPIGISVL